MDPASVASEFIEAFNRSDWDRFRPLCSPDVTYSEKGTNRNAKGVEEILQVAHAWKTAFPDIRGNIWTQVSCGNIALLEITWTGTNDGPIEMASGTLQPTGKSVEFDNAEVHVVENGQLVEFRNYGDFITMLTQLGVMPG